MRTSICPQCQKSAEVDDDPVSGKVCCRSCGVTIEIASSNNSCESTVPFTDVPADEARPVIGGYEVLGEIARGGMGVVFRARQRTLNRIVALKVILSGSSAGREEVSRFRREAEAVARLEHPGIVPVYEVGNDAERCFLAMAYLPGGTLASRCNRRPLPPREAATLMVAIAKAIHFAHQQNVIHRDIKPSNILFDDRESPKIADFGLAKQTDSHSELTLTGQILGTPAYMSPEQARGEDVGELADIYSLGATLYCMLTGNPPFQAASSAELLHQVIQQEPRPLRSWNVSIPGELETICLKCLRKAPLERYQSAEAMADDLDRWLRGEPIHARPVRLARKMWLWTKRHPARAIGIGMLGLSLSLAFLLALTVQSGASERRRLKVQLAWRQHLEQSYQLDRLALLAQSPDYRQAVREADTLVSAPTLTPVMTYDIACVYALAAASVDADLSLTGKERSQQRVHLLKQSLLALEAARSGGYFQDKKQQQLLLSDPHLNPVRSDPAFIQFAGSVQGIVP